MGIKIDRHTDLINWVCSAFDQRFSGHLVQIHRYDEYRPEPEVEIKDGRIKTPDIIAVNYEKQIALVIDCKGGLDEEMRKKFGVEIDVGKIKNQVDDYATILHSSLVRYFKGLKESEMDVIIAIYPDLEADLKGLEKNIDVKKRALWLINLDEKAIYKTLGSHTDTTLDDILSPSRGVPLPSHYPSIINFSRDSNKDHIAAEALIRLLHYAIYNSDFEFTIEKIDGILTGDLNDADITNMMPLLWQINKEEKFGKWRHMVGRAIENKWMREAYPGVYRFLMPHKAIDMDDNITTPSLGNMIRRIKETCGLHG